MEVGAYKNATHIYVSTLNFLVTEAGTSNWYAIISGHAQTDGEDVWQPATANPNDFIGHSDDVAGNRYSDSAIVPLSGVSAYKMVYGPTESTYVIGQINFAQQNVGNSVTMVGKVSGYRVGTIQVKYSQIGHPKYGVLYNQVAANYYAQSGDSGGPIIFNYREDGVLKTLAWGIEVGSSGSYEIYSPPDGIETDFGVDFNFG